MKFVTNGKFGANTIGIVAYVFYKKIQVHLLDFPNIVIKGSELQLPFQACLKVCFWTYVFVWYLVAAVFHIFKDQQLSLLLADI